MWEDSEEILKGLIKDVNDLQDELDKVVGLLEQACAAIELGDGCLMGSVAYNDAAMYLEGRDE